MGFFRRIAGFLGLTREEEYADARHREGGRTGGAGHPRAAARGFSAFAPVAVERTSVRPVLVPCDPGEGGVQGFRWYKRRLRMDEDGDVADEFLSEVIAQMPATHNQIAPPKFQVKYNARPTAVAVRTLTGGGDVHPRLQ